MNGKGVAKVGHIVMVGNVRAIVIRIEGTSVKVRGFGVKKVTGDIVQFDWVQTLPASECAMMYESFSEMRKAYPLDE